MSRTLLLLATLLSSAALVVPSAYAGPKSGQGKGKGKGKTKGKSPKGKGGKGWPGKGGKGKGGKGKGGKGKGGKPKVIGTVSGAGQRMAFSFGGQLRARDDGSVKGKFYLSAHPLSPPGNMLNVSCIYNTFSEMTIEDDTATFRATGRCRRLNTDGSIDTIEAQNLIQIVDNGSNDAIDVNFVGSTGIAVPGGTLSFGDFQVTGAT